MLEETGLTDAAFGPVVWYDEVILADVSLTQMLFRQHYIVARTRGGALSRAGWQNYEHDLTDEMRWWALPEIEAAAETFYPEALAELLPDVLAGRVAPEPLVIRTLDGPVKPVPRPPGAL